MENREPVTRREKIFSKAKPSSETSPERVLKSYPNPACPMISKAAFVNSLNALIEVPSRDESESFSISPLSLATSESAVFKNKGARSLMAVWVKAGKATFLWIACCFPSVPSKAFPKKTVRIRFLETKARMIKSKMMMVSADYHHCARSSSSLTLFRTLL